MSSSRSRQRRVRQVDIADAAGVSVSTVSRVLSDTPGISTEIRDTVRGIAHRMGYRFREPSHTAALSRATVFLGSAPTERESGDTVYSNVVIGIRDAASAVGLPVSIAVRERVGVLPPGLLDNPQVGVFFLGIDPNETSLELIVSAKVPTVLVNGLDPDLLVDAVAPANFFGGRLAARYLLERGHRRLLHISNRKRWTLARRAQGFLQGINELAGGEAVADMLDVEHLSETMFPAMDAYLKENRFDYTAVFCGNDIAAITMIQALRANGFDVPGAVSILGFDDLELAALSHPPLTTLRVDWRHVGTEAVRLMLDRLENPDRSPIQVQVGVRLIERGSVTHR